MQRIAFETAKLAKEKKVNLECLGYYKDEGTTPPFFCYYPYGLKIKRFTAKTLSCAAPLQADLQKWLRDKHGVAVLVHLDNTLSYYWTITPLHPKASIQEQYTSNNVWCGHYEECLEDGLEKALSFI